MIKYIIFDFDGTLVDSKDIAIAVYNQLAEKYKFKKVLKEDVEVLKRLSIPERCKFLKLPIYKLPLLTLELYQLYRESLHHLILFKGIKELLGELKRKGYQLAVISSNSENNISAFLRNNQISAIEEIICSGNIFGKDKMINSFLKAHRLKNSEVIYIGDELRDIVACKKSGVKVIWVGWGYDIIEVVKQALPDYIVHTPDEILSIV